MSEKQTKHDLVAALRLLADELGRTPTRDEFEAKFSGARYQLGIQFGGRYGNLLGASGLEVAKASRVKITDSVFERGLVKHLEDYRAREEEVPPLTQGPYPHIAVISDIHWPFHSQRVLDRFFRYVGDEKPAHVVIAGDAWDMYSHAKFPKSHNVFTPREEEAASFAQNTQFWAEVQKLAPSARCYQLLGNHDVRPLKRILETMPSLEDWISEAFKKRFSFTGVETVFDPREELFIEEVMIHHGHFSRLGQHRDFALRSAIVGHTHMPGVTWKKIRGGQLFEMNCGLAGDPKAKGLTYTPQKTVPWVNAFGVLEPDGPRNIVV